MCLYFRVNRKHDTYKDTYITPLRVWFSVRKKQKFVGKRIGRRFREAELCGKTVYKEKENICVYRVHVSDFTECQQIQT